MVKDSEACVRLDSVGVEFDDERLVANAGLVLIATLSRRLGIGRLVEEAVRLGKRTGAAQLGRKVLTLIHAIAAGADSIDDTEVLRSGATEALLGHKAMAPSTLGTFLRAFTFGHVRQLDKVLGEAIGRVWAMGAGPGAKRLTIDIDSFVGEVYGRLKQGASFGYTGVRGYHPLLATRAGTGEVLHVRTRKGAANSGRGALRFCEELVARVRRAGATGEIGLLKVVGESGVAAGVRRISLATSLYRAAMSSLIAAATEVKGQGTFGYLERTAASPDIASYLKS